MFLASGIFSKNHQSTGLPVEPVHNPDTLRGARIAAAQIFSVSWK